MQLCDAEAVQVSAAVVQVLIVFMPCGDGIIRDACGGEDGFPKLFNGLMSAQFGEKLFGRYIAEGSLDSAVAYLNAVYELRLISTGDVYYLS